MAVEDGDRQNFSPNVGFKFILNRVTSSQSSPQWDRFLVESGSAATPLLGIVKVCCKAERWLELKICFEVAPHWSHQIFQRQLWPLSQLPIQLRAQ